MQAVHPSGQPDWEQLVSLSASRGSHPTKLYSANLTTSSSQDGYFRDDAIEEFVAIEIDTFRAILSRCRGLALRVLTESKSHECGRK